MENQENKQAKKEKALSEEKRQQRLKIRKKLKYGGLATTVTVIVIAVIVLLNVVVTQVAKRYPDAVLDLTTSSMYKISDETLDYIKNLDKDVEIAVSLEESNLETDPTYKVIAETIAKYASYSDHISVTYFDTAKDPDILAKYQELYGNTIGPEKIIVNSGKRIKVVDCLMDMFELDDTAYQYYYYYGYGSLSDCITGFKGEQTLTTAIMNVTDSNPKAVGVISQSGGNYIYSATKANIYAMSATQALLSDNGYDVTELDLVTDTLDTSAYDILVLPAPAVDLTMDAVTKLKDFLYNNGNLGKQLIYIADFTQSSTPNLDAFLNEWNISVDRSYVNDEDSSSNQAAQVVLGNGKAYSFPRVTVTAEDAYTGNLNNPSLPIVAPMARPIDVRTANNGRTVNPLLTTSGNSYRYPLGDVIVEAENQSEALSGEEPTEAADDTAATTTTTSFDTASAVRGENTVMALCRDQQATGGDFIESDLIYIGSMSILDVNLLSDSSYNNAEYFIGLLNAVCGKEDQIVIASKDLTKTTISATEAQLKVLRAVVVFLIPLAVVAAGIVVAVRRRYQ